MTNASSSKTFLILSGAGALLLSSCAGGLITDSNIDGAGGTVGNGGSQGGTNVGTGGAGAGAGGNRAVGVGGRSGSTGVGGTTGSTGGATGTGGRNGVGGSVVTGAGGQISGAGGAVAGAGPTIGGCPVFPADNAWNRDVSADPVDPMSATYITSIGAGTGLHPDFGTGVGIPFVVVPGTQPKVPITFDVADESDPGPYPIPSNIPLEDGNDSHGLVIDSTTCFLYEVFALAKGSGTSWTGGSGAIWHLKENWTRPAGWTSADAAGLAIFPGLARYEEVAAGEIKHALRFTVSSSQNGYVAPASHQAGGPGAGLPPMGLRVRLKASVNIASFSPQAKIILTALKKYGMIVADNGSNWFITGAPNAGWNDDDIGTIWMIHGSDFEVIKAGPITH